MNIKIGGRKTNSYYKFLQGIDEEHLPVFSDLQVAFINYLSNLLPLVRKHEYLIFDCLLHDKTVLTEIETILQEHTTDYKNEEFNHALEFLPQEFVAIQNDHLQLLVALDDQFREYVADLLEYGLTRYTVDYGDTNDFMLWKSYRMDQVQMKFLKNPRYNQVGTYYYDHTTVIFASLKKDASVEERLNYKDKFLNAQMFQWETITNVSDADLQKLLTTEVVYLFIRKVSTENGMTLPFTYVGNGKLTNPRKQVNIDPVTQKSSTTYLFDIPMENELPDYLQYDFGLLNR